MTNRWKYRHSERLDHVVAYFDQKPRTTQAQYARNAELNEHTFGHWVRTHAMTAQQKIARREKEKAARKQAEFFTQTTASHANQENLFSIGSSFENRLKLLEDTVTQLHGEVTCLRTEKLELQELGGLPSPRDMQMMFKVMRALQN